jgi:hypothetical protein
LEPVLSIYLKRFPLSYRFIEITKIKYVIKIQINVIENANKRNLTELNLTTSIGTALVIRVGRMVMQNILSLLGKIAPGYSPGRRNISKI